MQIENNANLRVTFEGKDTDINTSRSVKRDVDPELMIDMVKTTDKGSAFVGEIITYTVEIKVSDIGDEVMQSVFSDSLEPHLELVPNSVKIDGVVHVGGLSNIPLTLTANKTIEIEYKCKML